MSISTLRSFPSNASSLSTCLWEGGLTWWPPTCCSFPVPADSVKAGFALAGTWVSPEAMGKGGILRLGTGLGRVGAGPADKAPLCRAGPAGSPINSPIMLGSGPRSLPSRHSPPREHRGRQAEVAVVLGGQGDRRRVREEGRVPGLLHHGLSGCCWVLWNAALPGATSFGGKMPKIGSRQAQGGQLDTAVLTSPPSSHQTLPVPKVATALLLCPGAGTSKWAARA